MKIFFSWSVAAMLGFVSLNAVNAQENANDLWKDAPVYPTSVIVKPLATGRHQIGNTVLQQGPCDPNGAPPQLVYPQADEYGQVPIAPQPMDGSMQTPSSVPYFYGGESTVGTTTCNGNNCSGLMSSGTQSYSGGNVLGSGRLAGLTGVNRGSSTCNPSPWFGGVNGLIFFRDDADEVFLTYPNGSPLNRVLTTRSVDADPFGGVEAMFGRNLSCNRAIVGSYWGLFADQDVYQYNGDPETALPTLDRLTYNGANTVNFYMNNAVAHRVRIKDEFHNVELNLLQRNYVQSRRLNRIDTFAGARYFRFDECFQYASAYDAANFGANINDMYYDIRTQNNLWGFQLGGTGYYCLAPRLSLVGGTKAGIYANHIQHTQSIYGSAGNAVTNTGAYNGREYNINSTKNDVSFLGELDLGMRYAVTQNWSANFGYRGIFVNGVAHTTDQIPNNFADLRSAEQVNSNGSLILHGIYIGATCNF
jgi:hypothetical protein